MAAYPYRCGIKNFEKMRGGEIPSRISAVSGVQKSGLESRLEKYQDDSPENRKHWFVNCRFDDVEILKVYRVFRRGNLWL